MAAKNVKTKRDYPTDRKGFVHIKNGKTVSAVLPESVGVWLEDGWTVVDDGKETVEEQSSATAASQKKD